MTDESEQRIQKRTLLQQYEIPIEFLDFSYIETCGDEKMVERIVKILRSGQEGFYPDLTKFAEDRLKTLKPDSKMLRTEVPVLKKEFLDPDERNQIDEDMKTWIGEMKKQDQEFKDIKPMEKPEHPIRKLKPHCDQQSQDIIKPVERTKSTDYSKWDKFDAEAAELKIDLDDERQREVVELKNKKNLNKAQLIQEIGDAEVDCLTDFEKDHLSLKYKEKGNECFKAKEYDEAIKEYSQSLRVKPSAAAFNNRALICKLFLPLKNN